MFVENKLEGIKAEKMPKINEENGKKINKLMIVGQAFALASTITFQLAIPVLMGAFGGRYLDGKLGTEPWLLLGGLFLGLAGGVAGMLRIVRRFMDRG